ncbi:nitronate monooxygenase [Bradyrhizobium sp. 44]|nr:nitronate monooxygenase [Bradyrhizobium sp. 44]
MGDGRYKQTQQTLVAAGGHAGRLSPFALVQETRQWFNGPIALSGAISTGDSILAARALGADFAYVGSAFIATQEATAVEGHKSGIVEGSAEQIVYLPPRLPLFQAYRESSYD